MQRHRTTIELDPALVELAKQALGETTVRATVEEALRRAVTSAGQERAVRSKRQSQYLQQLATRAELDVLAAEAMWR